MIHLDTSFLIRSLRPGSREDGMLRSWLGESVPLCLSAIAWAEYLCGGVSERTAVDVRAFLHGIVPLGEEESHLAAEFFNATGRRRGSFADCMIAATATVAGASLATTNQADFVRFVDHGLRLISGSSAEPS
ncbi:MAG: PIN domain-containing protein [Pseudomonadales bacterium]